MARRSRREEFTPTDADLHHFLTLIKAAGTKCRDPRAKREAELRCAASELLRHPDPVASTTAERLECLALLLERWKGDWIRVACGLELCRQCYERVQGASGFHHYLRGFDQWKREVPAHLRWLQEVHAYTYMDYLREPAMALLQGFEQLVRDLGGDPIPTRIGSWRTRRRADPAPKAWTTVWRDLGARATGPWPGEPINWANADRNWPGRGDPYRKMKVIGTCRQLLKSAGVRNHQDQTELLQAVSIIKPDDISGR
jgi:hypothetical protein